MLYNAVMRLNRGFLGLFLILSMARINAEPTLSYFRSDRGLGGVDAGALPDRFDSLDVLRWKAPLESGHSTPVVIDGMVVLTTYDSADQELATVAMDFETGDRLWSAQAPTKQIESFHRVGSPASATVANS